MLPEEIFDIMDFIDDQELKDRLFKRWLQKELSNLDDSLKRDMNTAEGMCSYSLECELSSDAEPAKKQYECIAAALDKKDEVLFCFDFYNLFSDKSCQKVFMREKVGCAVTRRYMHFSDGQIVFTLPCDDFQDIYLKPIGRPNNFKAVIEHKSGVLSFTTDEINVIFLLKRIHSHMFGKLNKLEHFINLPPDLKNHPRIDKNFQEYKNEVDDLFLSLLEKK